MLDLHRLVLLREVQLRGSITAAARALSYTHSAVSQHLALLEKEAGVPLLEKVGRGVRLTPAAEDLVLHADEILRILERAEADLAASDTRVRGVLRLAAFTTISRYTVPQVIASLETQHPELVVHFQQVEPEQGLLLLSSRRADVVIADSFGALVKVPDDLHAEVLIDDPVRAYLPRGSTVNNVAGLAELRWIADPEGAEAHAWVRQFCREHGFDPNITYQSADLLFHLLMVRRGLAGAFLPDLLVRGEGSDLQPTELLGPDHRRQISFYCRAGAEKRPAVQACRDAFVAELGVD